MSALDFGKSSWTSPSFYKTFIKPQYSNGFSQATISSNRCEGRLCMNDHFTLKSSERALALRIENLNTWPLAN